MVILRIIFILTFHLHLGRPIFSACNKYGDTSGKWYNVTNLNQTHVGKEWIRNHFYDGFFGGVLQFSNIWLPENCSHRRFNNRTIGKSVNQILENRRFSGPKLEIIFIGDSLLRGILCGIGRIISGNEIDGPNINGICGGGRENNGKFLSPNNYGQFHSVDFRDNLRLTFIYTKTFHFKHMNYIMETAINMKPYVVIVNTGIWDFDSFARAHRTDKLLSKECRNMEN
jgi:hypothetical protein